MSLALFTAVFEWVEQLRIQTCQASEILSIDLIGFALVFVDEPHFTRIGYQDLVAALLEHSANPGRVGARLDGYAQRPLSEQKRRLKASGVVRSLPSSITSPLSVSTLGTGRSICRRGLKSGCNLWLLAATIHSGLILLPGPL
jgi:hypothetical protein